jgi:hypothetical protein
MKCNEEFYKNPKGLCLQRSVKEIQMRGLAFRWLANYVPAYILVVPVHSSNVDRVAQSA